METPNLPALIEKPKKKHKPRSGRPKIEINWDEFEKLCAIQCTEIEMEAWFRCDQLTLRRAVKRQYKKTFEQVYQEKKGIGKMSLRRQQWTAALKGNIVMQIWLGKQHLDQRDKFPDDTPDERELTLRIVYGEKSGGNGEDKEIELKDFGDRNPLARAASDPKADHREQGEA
jgi:hypothetical protein